MDTETEIGKSCNHRNHILKSNVFQQTNFSIPCGNSRLQIPDEAKCHLQFKKDYCRVNNGCSRHTLFSQLAEKSILVPLKSTNVS